MYLSAQGTPVVAPDGAIMFGVAGYGFFKLNAVGIKEWEYIDNPTDFLGQPAYSEVEKAVVFVHGK